MPIVHMTTWDHGNNLPKDAKNFIAVAKPGYEPMSLVDGEYVRLPVHQGPFIAYCTYETHHGLCLFDREDNRYDDSDFYMTYWDTETDSPKSVVYASTRGWSYPCYASSVDATPEILEKYRLWEQKRNAEARETNRRRKVMDQLEIRRNIQRISKEFNVPYIEILMLRKLYPKNIFLGILSLFNPKIRSNFKVSLRNQLIAWISDKKYPRPFTRRQQDWLI